MRKLFITVALLSALHMPAAGQEQTIRPDTSALPRLEIPEITIVGKKAITLPFARKGEIYDVDIYQAPPPDSSLLEDRPAIALPIGSLPRYEEPLVPWHVSAEGGLRSFSTGMFHTFLDYNAGRWGVYGNGGFRTTQGHRDNASGNAVEMEANAHSLVSTDNDLLRTFRVAGAFQFMHDTYGRFGHLYGGSILGDRTRNNVVFDTRLASLDRESGYLDATLRADIWRVTDAGSGGDGSVTAVSPDLGLAWNIRSASAGFTSGVTYAGTSLNYGPSRPASAVPQESPSLFTLHAEAEWEMSDHASIDLGLKYDHGTDDFGSTSSLFAPVATLNLQIDRDRRVSFWFRPEMALESYGERVREYPYIDRAIDLRPERSPVQFGASFFYNSGAFSGEFQGSYRHGTGRGVLLSSITDTAIGPPERSLRMSYVDADQVVLQANGTMRLSQLSKLIFEGTIQPSFRTGTTTQLPMVPALRLSGRLEVDPVDKFVLWGSAGYESKKNVDLEGTETLGDRILFGAGASLSAIPKTVLTFEAANLLNTSYEWWQGYPAPGRQFSLNAKVNVR